ncbi:MAG: cation diffusion facilitator family transporter [Bacteroidota bacterium]
MEHHHHDHNHKAEANLKMAFWLNAAFAVIEIAGGLFTNSVAILSNAFHDMGDSVALGLAWYFQRVSKKQRDDTYTYGYKRYSLVGATISAFILLAGSVIIITRAIPRLFAPEPVHINGMFYLAIVGVIINGLAMFRLRAGHSQNEKVISLHLLEDVMGWVAVLIASLVMKFFDFPVIDPLLSLLITAFVLFRVFGNMRQTFRIFMQATPSNEQVEHFKTHLLEIDGVIDVHDMHFWTLDGTFNIASLHISVNPGIAVSDTGIIKQEVRAFLKAEGFTHTTIEIEPMGTLCELQDC